MAPLTMAPLTMVVLMTMVALVTMVEQEDLGADEEGGGISTNCSA